MKSEPVADDHGSAAFNYDDDDDDEFLESQYYPYDAEEDEEGDSEEESLRCLDCDLKYYSREHLHKHLLHHVQQPFVKLDRVQGEHTPLKITLKNRTGNSFEIVSPGTSPTSSEPGCVSNSLDEVSREDDHPHHQEFDESNADLDYYQEEEEAGAQEESEDHQTSEIDETDPFGELEGSADNSQSIPGSAQSSEHSQEETDDRTNVNFSPNLAEVIGGAFLADIDSPIPFEAPSGEHQLQESPKEADTAEGSDSFDLDSGNNSNNTAELATLSNGSHANSPPYGSIPGAEPTPPPEPSPTGATEYPKIKIKTTELFKDPEPRGCTITEITDDNPTGDPNLSATSNPTPIWTTPSLEDPLKLSDSDNLLSFLNNDRNHKDLGYSSSSDNEFISLDTFNERNRTTSNAMQLYNSNSNAVATSSSLESITGLPMQALAQQVSRLNPSNGQGVHQQNVLINIQQFPSQPQQQYPQPQHQPMYPPHYPPQPPMHQPYPYQPPPNPMYPHYPPAPGYPPQHPPAPHMPPPPPQHQMGQMQPPQMGQQQQQQPPVSMGAPPGQPPNSMVPSTQGQQMPPPNQMPQPPNSMQCNYRPPMSPNGRAPAPRGPQPSGARMPGGPRPPMNRAPGMRPRAPLVRPRGAGNMPVRGQMRPRMGAPQNGIRPGGQTSPIKRGPDQNQAGIKRKKVDVLTPSDKDDDDCQVICMQPKNTGLPQIESVQGAESVENSIMKLSDSITLSVTKPAPKPASSPQKSDAKAVANVLASRGITVTASGKPKESPTKQGSAVPTALSLNGSVSIVAASKNATSKSATSENLPTVDLTDDTPSPGSPGKNRQGLPYRCDLCPAQYPNAIGLNKHRQTYHKTNSGMCELGVPLINLKQPGMMQKLSQLGIHNYIPLPGAGPEGTYALPIISTKSPGNVAQIGATQMLSLGPVRAIPRLGVNNNNIKK